MHPTRLSPKLAARCAALTFCLLMTACSGPGASVQASAAPAASSQLIVRFKPGIAPLSQSECAGAYLALAGAQQGVDAVVLRQLFSGAYVLGAGPALDSASRLTAYLSRQPEVDYAELDSSVQTQTTAALTGGAAGKPSPLTQTASIFRKACGASLTEPR
jgi:hypothetical protein